MEVVEIDPKQYKSLREQMGLKIVWLYASWCGPCRHFHSTFETVAIEFANEVQFLKYNVDQGPVEGPKLQGIPTVRFFSDGVQVDELVGVQEKGTFMNVIKKHKKQG